MVLTRINLTHNGLGENWMVFFGPKLPYNTYKPYVYLPYITYKYGNFCHTFHTSMARVQPPPWGTPRFQRAVCLRNVRCGGGKGHNSLGLTMEFIRVGQSGQKDVRHTAL